MTEQNKPETIHSIVADIRNKLGPLVNLAQMINSGSYEQMRSLIEKEAERGVVATDIIAKQLEKIVIISEKNAT